MTWGMTAVAGATLVGGYMASQATKSAASQYANSANQGIDYSKQVYGDIGTMTWPYRNLGTQANNAIGSMLPGQYQQYDQSGNAIGSPITGSGYLTANPTMDDITKLMPNYEFGLKQGMGQFNAGLNAAGGLVSGNAIQGGQQFAQDYAGNALQQGYNNYQANRQNVANNLFNISNIGAGGVATTANAGTNTASNVTSTLGSIGNANASATMGANNAWQSGLNNISNYAMLYGLRAANQPKTPGVG